MQTHFMILDNIFSLDLMKVISAVALSIAVMFLIAIITSSALAQESNALLPEPRILPDNHLYFLKRAFEMIWAKSDI
jgi:hypothetical protein